MAVEEIDNDGRTKEERVQQNLRDDQHAATVQQEELTKTKKIVLGLILACTLFVVALEQTVATSSLPQIMAALGSSEGYVWIGTAYILASASVMPMYGKISDIWGRKPIIMVAILLFVVGSAISGAAQNMSMMIGGRVVQGLGGGGIMGLINIIISDLIPLKERGTYMGIIGATWTVASAIGPIIGGSLTEAGQWRWCFLINCPIGGAALVGCWFVLKINSPKTTVSDGFRRIDIVGILMSAGATCLLMIALDWGGTKYPWNSKLIICFLVFSGVIYIAFLFYEAYIPPEPLTPPRLFKNRTRAASYAGSVMHALAFMGIIYYLPFMFQSGYGVTPLVASAYIIPQAMLMGVTSGLGGWIISKFGRYVEQQRLGMAAMTAFIGLLSTLTPDSSVAQRIIYPALYGIPVGFNFQSFLLSMQTQISRRDIGVATATMVYLRQIGLSVGIAIGGVAFQNKVTELATQDSHPEIRKLLAGNAPTSVNEVHQLPVALRRIAARYYMDAFKVVFYVFIGFAGVGFLLTWLIRQHALKMRDEDEKPAAKVSTDEEKQQDRDAEKNDSNSS